MTSEAMRELYCEAHPACRAAHWDAWAYGSDDPDALLALTLSGTKTATASAGPVYEYEGAALPKAGDLSVLLNTEGEALCIIEDTHVSVVPFEKVEARHAYLEGEGDRSLAYWRRVHKEVFSMELGEIGQVFREDMPVVLEEFRVVYPTET